MKIGRYCEKGELSIKMAVEVMQLTELCDFSGGVGNDGLDYGINGGWRDARTKSLKIWSIPVSDSMLSRCLV